MHTNKWWKIWLLVVLTATIWFTGSAIYGLYRYSQLNARIQPHTFLLSVHEVSSDKYLFEATYTFIWKEKHYEGRELLSQPIFRNPQAAADALLSYQTGHLKLWFSPSSPKYSSLQKGFPLKESITAIVIWGFFLYFICLGYYVRKLEH